MTPGPTSFYLVFTRYQLRLALAHRLAYGGDAPAVLAYHGRVRLGDPSRQAFPVRIPFDASTGVRAAANAKTYEAFASRLSDMIAASAGGPRPQLIVASAAYPVANWLLVRFSTQLDTAILADGLSAYLPLRTSRLESLKMLARSAYARLRHGVASASFFRHPHGLDSRYVHTLFAEWPQFMPNHGKPLHGLPPAFPPPEPAALARPRDAVWFLGQPHLGPEVSSLAEHLERLAAALRADHPTAQRFIYKCHHFEPSGMQPLLARLGFEPDLRADCAEELLCEEPPLAVYSYRSTALLSLRAVLPPEITVASVAPWLVQPPGECLLRGRIEDWLVHYGVDRPRPGSAMGQLEQALAQRSTFGGAR